MLDIEKTTDAIRRHASRREFITYGQVAAESNLAWSAQVRSLMRPHLEAVCERMLTKAGAMISAIVVNQTNLRTGELEPGSLTGFVDCARRLGLGIADDRLAFLRQQQELTFRWAERTGSR
jgi:hypothetical protein